MDGDRWLPLTNRAIEIISRVKQINQECGYVFGDFLFVRGNKILSPDALDCQVKRGCEYIGMPVKTMHKIRKTYASTLLHNGVNLSTVKDMLGHADESTTLRHYIYSIEDKDTDETMVLRALEDDTSYKREKNPEIYGTARDRKIILFNQNKEAENPRKIRFSAPK